MYLAHFGLAEPPFSLTPDPRFLYLGPNHREGLAHLIYGVGEAGGFVQLTGEAGTGKTTLGRAMAEAPPPGVDVALVINPRLTPAELVATIGDELGLPPCPGEGSLKTLVDRLNRHLLALHAAGRRPVVIIDEAQGLSREALEQVRLLTNLETTTRKLLQVVLIGQPELAATMARRDLRQLAQRVTARFHLVPLDRRETAAYVAHRMQTAGATRPIFGAGALALVHRFSRGLPRLINAVCDRALLGAFVQGDLTVGRRTVRRAAAELQGRRRPHWSWGAGLAVAGSLAVAAGWWASDLFRTLDRATVASPPAEVHPEAPVVSPKPRPSRLEALLQEGALAGETEEAFAAASSRWGVDFASLPGATACERVVGAGLHCVYGRGTWEAVVRHNRPAILELARGDERHHVAVVGVDGDDLLLAAGTVEWAVPRAEVEALWGGDYAILWRSDPPLPELLRPGESSASVARLAELLGRIDGQGRRHPSGWYDAALQRRVVAFQHSRGLDPDGLVGEQTWAALSREVEGTAPTLEVPSARRSRVVHP